MNHLEQLKSIAATPPASFTPGDCAALAWAVQEIVRLNSRNRTLESQTQKLADLAEDMRETLRETRQSLAEQQFEATIAADLREATAGDASKHTDALTL